MKYQLNLHVQSVNHLSNGLIHLELAPANGEKLPPMQPGQFVEVAVDKAKVLLNRPFSIYNATDSVLELLVKPLGRGSEAMSLYNTGDTMRVIAPLGRGFELPEKPCRVLLVGGGVGVAPMLYVARALCERGIRPTLVYGERTAPDARLKSRLSQYADLEICTDDGSEGLHGLVTKHPAVADGHPDHVLVCGPAPMMKAMHHIAKERGLCAQFSLENKMACGLGACLCCVEQTTTGNRCVCTDGPVFKAEELPW